MFTINITIQWPQFTFDKEKKKGGGDQELALLQESKQADPLSLSPCNNKWQMFQ